MTYARAAVAAATALLLCSCTDGEPARPGASPAAADPSPTSSASDATSVQTTLRDDPQEVSVGTAMTGGGYVLVIECHGATRTGSARWTTGPASAAGSLLVPCAQDGARTAADIHLQRYAKGVSVGFSGLAGAHVAVSVSRAR